MVSKVLLGVQSGGESEASVRLTKRGRCELIFERDGNKISFPCSLSALINVGLGARTHLASDFGSCALTCAEHGVKIALTPWGYGYDQYLIPMDVYADALADLSEAHATQSKISLR
jgi:hypothetical protein